MIGAVIGVLVACSGGGEADVGAEVGEPADQRRAEELASPDGGEVEETLPFDFGGEISPDEWKLLYGGQCPLDQRTGLVRVHHLPLEGYVVAGTFRDRVYVPEVMLQVDEEGPCRVFERAQPFCAPMCAGKQQCSLAEKCEPAPLQIDVGALTFTGLSEELALTADGGLKYKKWGFTKPLFEPWAMVELTVGEGGPTLQGHGIELLELSAPPEEIRPAQPLELAWTASDGPGRIEVIVSLQNHATSPVSVICEIDDLGSLTVPARLVDLVLSQWLAGTVVTSVIRRTTDAHQGEGGCTEFQLFSERFWDLKVVLD